MSYLENIEVWIVGGIGTLYAFVTGNFGTAALVLFGVMLLDVVSGLFKGASNKNLKSAIMSIGLMKKGGIILSILFAYLLDILVSGGQPVFTPMMIWLAIGNEGMSFVENITALGVEVPDALKKRLGQFADKYDEVHIEKEIDRSGDIHTVEQLAEKIEDKLNDGGFKVK